MTLQVCWDDQDCVLFSWAVLCTWCVPDIHLYVLLAFGLEYFGVDWVHEVSCGVEVGFLVGGCKEVVDCACCDLGWPLMAGVEYFQVFDGDLVGLVVVPSPCHNCGFWIVAF